MNSKHTSGPLHAQGVRVLCGNTIIAETFPTSLVGGPGEELTNARLFAEAPAMLEALRELVEIVEGFDIQREEDEAPLPSVIRARAILARIDG